MKRPWRVWVAFPIAPLLGSGASVATLAATFDNHLSWPNLLAVFAYSSLIALGATLVLAMPSYLFLRRLGPVRLWHCAAAGAAIGLIGGGIGIVDGLTTGFLFWAIAIWRNNDLPPEPNAA